MAVKMERDANICLYVFDLGRISLWFVVLVLRKKTQLNIRIGHVRYFSVHDISVIINSALTVVCWIFFPLSSLIVWGCQILVCGYWYCATLCVSCMCVNSYMRPFIDVTHPHQQRLARASCQYVKWDLVRGRNFFRMTFLIPPRAHVGSSWTWVQVLWMRVQPCALTTEPQLLLISVAS